MLNLTKIKLELDLPSVIGWTKISQTELSAEIKKILAVYLYSKGSLSLYQACKLAGVSKWEFFDINKEFKVPVPYDLEDLEQDRKVLRRISH